MRLTIVKFKSIAHRILSNSLIFSLLFLISATPSQTFDVEVQIKNIRNSKGRIQLQVYRNQESFEKETPWKSLTIPKNKMVNNQLTYTFKDLNAGVYGIALLDDENCNTEMDYGWLLPIEGFGFSDYYHKAWSKPKFHDFKFYLNKNKTATVVIRYL